MTTTAAAAESGGTTEATSKTPETTALAPNAAPPAAPKPAAAIAAAPPPLRLEIGDAVSPFAGTGNFELAQRMATALSQSTLVPKEYRGNMPNCMNALEMASRIGMPVLMVMQNMTPIYGKPSWSSKFLIAVINNASHEWSKVRWEWEGTKKDGDAWGCRAYAIDKATGDKCVGPLVDIKMAKDEGWYGRVGKESGEVASKWPTMPELMLMYRSAAFWARLYAPEKTLGLTSEEAEDIGGSHAALEVNPAALADVPHAETAGTGRRMSLGTRKPAEAVVVSPAEEQRVDQVEKRPNLGEETPKAAKTIKVTDGQGTDLFARAAAAEREPGAEG